MKVLGGFEPVADLGKKIIGQSSEAARKFAPIQCRNLMAERDARFLGPEW